MRDAVYEDVVGLKIWVTKDSKRQLINIPPKQAVEIINFIFIDIMGPGALNRLRTLVKFYITYHERGSDKGAAARAALLASDLDSPSYIRRFFGAYSKVERSRNHPSHVYAALQATRLNLELLEKYTELREMVQERDAGLLDFLEGSGFRPSKGVSWTSCIINYLASKLKISTTILQNTCQSAQGVKGLVDQFGPGIITVLPPGAMSR